MQWDLLKPHLIDPHLRISIEVAHFVLQDLMSYERNIHGLKHRKGLKPIGMPVPAVSIPQP